uniref:BZIP domain-containing protein n=1 Tax=Steinernema glaseri TaxID=37863 RepID=A0A1I7ZBY1_9BILA
MSECEIGYSPEPQNIDRIQVYTRRLKVKKVENDRKLAQKRKELAVIEHQIEEERERLRQLDLQHETLLQRKERLAVTLESAQARLDRLEESGAELVDYIRTERAAHSARRAPGSSSSTARLNSDRNY